jgi:hypothetical protein
MFVRFFDRMMNPDQRHADHPEKNNQYDVHPNRHGGIFSPHPSAAQAKFSHKHNRQTQIQQPL